MRNVSRRLARVEWQHVLQMAATAWAPHGISVDAMLAEAHHVFTLPPAQVREYFADIYMTLNPKESRAFDRILRRYRTLFHRRGGDHRQDPPQERADGT